MRLREDEVSIRHGVRGNTHEGWLMSLSDSRVSEHLDIKSIVDVLGIQPWHCDSCKAETIRRTQQSMGSELDAFNQTQLKGPGEFR